MVSDCAFNVRYSHCSNRYRVSVRFDGFGTTVNVSFNKFSVVVVNNSSFQNYLHPDDATNYSTLS